MYLILQQPTHHQQNVNWSRLWRYHCYNSFSLPASSFPKIKDSSKYLTLFIIVLRLSSYGLQITSWCGFNDKLAFYILSPNSQLIPPIFTISHTQEHMNVDIDPPTHYDFLYHKVSPMDTVTIYGFIVILKWPMIIWSALFELPQYSCSEKSF